MQGMKTAMLAATFTLSFGTGCKSEPAASSEALSSSGGRLVRVVADGKGFTPSSIEAKKGESLTLEFTKTSDKTCTDSVVFPELKLERQLPLNKPVSVTIPTEEARTIAFQCQ